MAPAGKRYLIHIELAGADVERLRNVVPRLHNAIERMSESNYVQAYHSAARDTLGYLLRTTLAAAQVRSRLKELPPLEKGQAAGAYVQAILDVNDRVFVLEIGEDYDLREFRSKIEPWLKHH
jgi:hypothetical protein